MTITRYSYNSEVAKEFYQAIKDGDEASFSKYYQDSLNALVRRIDRIIHDYDEAWDIAQDTFVKLWEQRQQIDPEKSLDGLISKMAFDKSLDLFKRKNVREKYLEESLYLQSEEGTATDSDVLMQEMERLINNAIENMPAQRRKVFEMHRTENLTYKQIAERLNISPETVKMHMKLALAEIKKIVSFIFSFLISNIIY